MNTVFSRCITCTWTHTYFYQKSRQGPPSLCVLSAVCVCSCNVVSCAEPYWRWGSQLSCFSFLSGRPPEPSCVSPAINGSSLPFMCGGPDRLSRISPTHTTTSTTTHRWDAHSVVCHNGTQQAFSGGTTAYSPPFNNTLKCIHSEIDEKIHTHTHGKIYLHWNCSTFSLANITQLDCS